MGEQFAVADLHLSQQSMCEFTGKDGHPLRPFTTAEEMDEEIVRRWNAVVPATGAKVYVLGDVAMKKQSLGVLGRLNGKKKLIYGNHDILKLKDYQQFFYEFGAYRVFDDLIMSHIPIHEESLKQRWIANVHGHLHDGRVMMDRWVDVGGEMDSYQVAHPRYLCVSVEQTDYSPISMDEIYARIRAQQEERN